MCAAGSLLRGLFRLFRLFRQVQRTRLSATGQQGKQGEQQQVTAMKVMHPDCPCKLSQVYGVAAANPMPLVHTRQMPEPLLDAVEISPVAPARAAILWLHGLGADGHDFEPLVPQLGIVEQLGVRVILPHAPRRPVTINGGMVMPAWYDIAGTDFRRGQDSAGIRASEQQLRALIEREISRGIAPQRILLAGFSQGGALVLHSGLRFPYRLAGILALSAYLPLADTLPAEATEANRAVPLMLAHGTSDPVVPLPLAEQSRDMLQRQGYRVDWHTYAMAHAVCPEEVLDIRAWLVDCLAANQG